MLFGRLVVSYGSIYSSMSFLHIFPLEKANGFLRIL